MLLDDVEGVPDRAGVYWSTQTIARQLDESQYSVVEFMAQHNMSHMISGIVTAQNYTLTSNLHTATLPSDYLYALSGQIAGKPAKLHIGGVGAVYENVNHLGVSIEGDSKQLVFIGGANTLTGTLWYYKVPGSFFANQNTNKIELHEPVYHAIMYHAAAVLSMKDGTNTRLLGRYKHAMKRIMSDIPTMSGIYDDNSIA